LEAHAVFGEDAAGVAAVGRVVDVRVLAADEGADAAGGGLGLYSMDGAVRKAQPWPIVV